MRTAMDNAVSSQVRALAAGDFAQIADCFANAGFEVRVPARGILQLTMPGQMAARTRLLLSVGIHGDETAPIEMLAGLLHKLADAPRALAVDLMVVVGNLAAIEQGKRFIDADLNRMFRAERGDLQTAAEAGRADALMRAAAAFLGGADAEKWHLDLHTAIRSSHYPTFAVVPNAAAHGRKQQLLGWLGQAGIGAAILSPASAGTFSAYTATQFGAASATVELGQVGALGDNDLSRFAEAHAALDAFLRNGQPPVGATLPHVFAVAQELVKRSEAFRMSFDRTTMNFTAMPPGALIAEDGDTAYRVGPVTEYVVFPNPDVRLGLRAGLMVVRSE